MNKKLKSGLLLLMLVGPLLFFGLLHLLGTNHYDIPKYYPEGVNANGDTIYHRVDDFELVNQFGSTVNLDDYRGKIFVVDFMFTTCPTICPKLSSSILYLQKAFRNHEDVMFLSHTIDPDHDNIDVLKEYADLYEAKEGIWNFVRGEKEVIYKLAKTSYKMLAHEGDGFTHTEKLALVDRNGIIRGYYDGTDKESVEKLLSEIRILLYEQ